MVITCCSRNVSTVIHAKLQSQDVTTLRGLRLRLLQAPGYMISSAICQKINYGVVTCVPCTHKITCTYIYVYIYTHTLFINTWQLMRFPGHFTRRFLNSKRLCQKQIQPLAQFLFAGHVPIFHMVDAMGQSRPSLCQCCTANSGATGGNSAELMRLENFEEIWKIFTHFYPPLHHTDPLYSVTVRR